MTLRTEIYRALSEITIASLLASCSNEPLPIAKPTAEADGSLLPNSTQVEIPPTQTLPSEAAPTLTPPVEIEIGAMGDIMLGRNVYVYSDQTGDFDVFDGLSPVLSDNDLNLANLESPVGPDCSRQGPNMGMTFCTDARYLTYLKQNKFVVALANNHENDNVGPVGGGIDLTRQLISPYDVSTAYSQRLNEDPLTLVDIKGITLGILSFNLVGPNSGTNYLGENTYEQMKNALKAVNEHKGRADWTVVILHWGAEYDKNPEPWQVEFGHKLVDAGARIIIGSHPHVVMDPIYEEYNTGVIFYSLGNGVFDQNIANKPETSTSFVIDMRLNKNQILEIQKYPFRMDPPSYQPVLTP